MAAFVDQFVGIINRPMLLISLIAILLIYGRLVNISKRSLPKIPLGFFILFLILSLIGPYVDTANWPSLGRTIHVLAIIALWFGIIRISAFILIDYVIGPRKAISVPTITRDLILVILYVIAVMVILRQQLNIDVTSLVATSAILTAVIGFALQETLGNLFSGLALNVEKPYKIGDWVTFDKYRGQVKGMSWRSTTLLTAEHETIVVPNNVISRSHIVNYSDPSSFIVSGFIIGLEYGAPPNRVRDVIMGTLRNQQEIDQSREIEVRVLDFGDFAVKYEVRYWIDIGDDLECADRIKSQVMTHLWYDLRRASIKIPYPVKVQYVGKDPDPAEHITAIAGALKGVDLFTTLKEEEVEILAKFIDCQEYAEGESVVKQNEPGDCMYIVAHGYCSVMVTTLTAKDLNVATLGPGDFFGEMSLLTGDPRSATVMAKTDAALYRIEKQDMLKLLETNPAISTTLSEALARRLTERQTVIDTAKTDEASTKPPTATQILFRIKNFFGLVK